MEVQMRGYSESDVIPIALIWNESGLADSPLQLQQVRNRLAKSTAVLVLTVDQKVVGWLRVCPCADGALARLAVVELAVALPARRQNFAAQLLQQELRLLPKQGFAGLFLPAVRAADPAVMALCARCKLNRTGTLQDYFSPGQDAASFYYACPPPPKGRRQQKTPKDNSRPESESAAAASADRAAKTKKR